MRFAPTCPHQFIFQFLSCQRKSHLNGKHVQDKAKLGRIGAGRNERFIIWICVIEMLRASHLILLLPLSAQAHQQISIFSSTRQSKCAHPNTGRIVFLPSNSLMGQSTFRMTCPRAWHWQKKTYSTKTACIDSAVLLRLRTRSLHNGQPSCGRLFVPSAFVWGPPSQSTHPRFWLLPPPVRIPVRSQWPKVSKIGQRMPTVWVGWKFVIFCRPGLRPCLSVPFACMPRYLSDDPQETDYAVRLTWRLLIKIFHIIENEPHQNQQQGQNQQSTKHTVSHG